MKILSVTIALTLATIIAVQTQTQSPGACPFDIRLSSQNDVDAFFSSYGCTGVTGILTIEGSNIFNVDSLHMLTSVGGLVLQNNPNLTDIDGLAGLTSVGSGGIIVSHNAVLTNIDGLSQILTSFGPVEVFSNSKLANIDGLNSLTSAAEMVRFIGNDSLVNLDGVSALRTITGDGQLVIQGNQALISVAGLHTLRDVESLDIVANPVLPNLDGLSSIQDLGRLGISSNDRLTNIDGLSNLHRVRTGNFGPSMISIHHNNSLLNIDGLSSVTTFGSAGTSSSITISFNPRLTNVNGLSGIGLVAGSFKRLNILWNTALTNYCGLYNMLVVTTASGACTGCMSIDFSNNAVAFTLEDVLFNCIPEGEECQNVALSTQNAVDAFPRLRGCKVVTGTLLINGPNITHLDSLREITSVFGLEVKNNPKLTSMHGLEGITESGHVQIASNSLLKNLEGLNSLARVNGLFSIGGNASLESLDGLVSLTRTENQFSISGNPKLHNLRGLEPLEFVHGPLTIELNSALQNLEGLNNLSAIGGSLQIRFNPWLENLDALAGLDSIGEFSNLSVRIANNMRLEWCCGLFKALTQRPLAGQVVLQDNKPSCTQQVIVESGPCCPAGSELPHDKVIFAENDWGIAPVATNVHIEDYQPGILYTLREEDRNIHVAGPQTGELALFVHRINEDTEYNVLARNPETGCTVEMTTHTLIHAFTYPSTCSNPPLDRQVVAEQDSGMPRMATNILVLNGEEGVVYALRKNDSTAWVSGPYPFSAGLHTGPVYETTTFNVLAIDEGTHCAAEMTTQVTITIDEGEQSARMASDVTTKSEKTSLQAFSVSPNPSSGEFDIELGKSEGTCQIVIRDMTGRTVARSVVTNQQTKTHIGLTDTPAGMYVLTVYNDQGIVATRKVIIR